MTRGALVARSGLVALALTIAAGSLGSALALIDGLRREDETAAELGVLTPGLADVLRRSESPVRARLHVARALLAAALEETPGDEGAAGVEDRRRRLEAAEEAARSVLADHAASWEAAAVAGAALYLQWSEARDPLLLQEYGRWEQPLLYALELAPDHRPPARYLAAAYLELWPVLSEEKRALAESLVASAFTDPRAFSQLLEPWLGVADPESALEPIPDRAWAWTALRARAGRAGDWSGYCAAWRRERRALVRDLRARLARAESLAAGGELARARRELLEIVAAAPPDRAFAPLVERALQLLPHGPRRGGPSEPAARWLAWALARTLSGGPQPLSVESLVRLRGLAFPGGAATGTAAPLSAWVELERGRPREAEGIEATSGSAWQSAWAPYHLLAARRHLDQERPDRARQALQQVHPEWHRHPVFAELAARLGQAGPETAAAPGELGGALHWTYSGDGARLAFRISRAEGGLGLTLAETPPQGAAVAVRWDGAALDCRPVGPGLRRLELPLELRPGVHELEVIPLAGGRVYPGALELLPPPPAARPG